eukprot:3795817-Rhodomonas_salina.3
MTRRRKTRMRMRMRMMMMKKMMMITMAVKPTRQSVSWMIRFERKTSRASVRPCASVRAAPDPASKCNRDPHPSAKDRSKR